VQVLVIVAEKLWDSSATMAENGAPTPKITIVAEKSVCFSATIAV
jgi:hypothetical protein